MNKDTLELLKHSEKETVLKFMSLTISRNWPDFPSGLILHEFDTYIFILKRWQNTTGCRVHWCMKQSYIFLFSFQRTFLYLR